jgi:hypothetical protein
MVSDLSAGQTRQNQGWGTNPPARTQKLRGSHGARGLAGASLQSRQQVTRLWLTLDRNVEQWGATTSQRAVKSSE